MNLPKIEPLTYNVEGKYEVTFDELLNVTITPLTKRTQRRYEKYGAPNYVRHFIGVRRQYLGYVYLIHFEIPYKHAKHYLGFTTNLENRLTEHFFGTSQVRLMEVIYEAGIKWHVSRCWVGDRYLERQKKHRKGATKFCPTCKALHSSN